MKPILSICVPTYNRYHDLIILLESIKKLLFTNILEISLCDDGSTDDTKNYINQKIKEGINIKYKFIEHTGRPRALKESILMSSGRYIIISDSDDSFIERNLESLATDIINNTYNLNEISGFSFLCGKNKFKIIGDKFPLNQFKSNLVDLKYLHNIKGDKCEVYEASILKKNMYSLIDNEKRIPTMYLHAKLNNNHFLCLNKILKIKKYSKDGMSKNIYYYKLKSPNYTYLTYYELYKLNFKNVNKFLYLKLSINYWRFYFHSSEIYKKKLQYKNKRYDYIIKIIGKLFYITDKIIYKFKYENRNS
tara:strand:+ start:1610 stop:2527 length:918 start_codon:yes stop_codon:yes gene_type:complete